MRTMLNFLRCGTRALSAPILLLVLTVVPLQAATTLFDYTWNFDASDSTSVAGFYTFLGTGNTPGTFQFEGGPGLHITSGTDGILGPFGYGSSGPVQNGSAIALTISAPNGGTIESFDLSFQLWTINTWDGSGIMYNGVYYANDYFQVALGGIDGRGCDPTVDLFCNNFTFNPNGFNDFPSPASPGGAGASFYRFTAENPQAQGNLPLDVSHDGYAVYDINLGTVNLAVPASQVVIIFRGLQMQQGWDESWALGGVSIAGFGQAPIQIGEPGGESALDGETPEPSTWVLGMAGLGLLAFRLRRRNGAPGN